MAWLGLVTAGVQAIGQAQQGRINAANSELQGIQDSRDANQSQVEGQQQAFNERRRAKILRSRALAVAGKSGAGISEDPTVANILEGIQGEGELRALNSLFEGDYLAQGLRSGARSKLNMGNAYRTAGNLNATSTLVGAGTSFYSKYGGDFFADSNPGRGGGLVSYGQPALTDFTLNPDLVQAPRLG